MKKITISIWMFSIAAIFGNTASAQLRLNAVSSTSLRTATSVNTGGINNALHATETSVRTTTANTTSAAKSGMTKASAKAGSTASGAQNTGLSVNESASTGASLNKGNSTASNSSSESLNAGFNGDASISNSSKDKVKPSTTTEAENEMNSVKAGTKETAGKATARVKATADAVKNDASRTNINASAQTAASGSADVK
ncbi:MAG TPA: hypothetical protein VG847_06405 [Chitinophagaceae bacterium]|nr:hypothetical protein [Chitinophagaceae bacterium]